MPNQINLNLYCDEIKEVSIRDSLFRDEKWAYIGILIVPNSIEKELISHLLDNRCGNPTRQIKWASCSPPCRFHAKNDKEVHYQTLDSKDEFFIGSRWLEFLLQDTILTYFYILGINLTYLDYSCFGEAKPSVRFERIYNRFFRTAISKSVKSYFNKYEKISILSIVHDKTELSYNYYFPWHVIFKLNQEDEKINFTCNEIEFLDSDHRQSGDDRSNLIQYIDLILGSFYNALHWSSKNENKTAISFQILPLLKRLMQNPSNINSQYKYVGRQCIDFFPKRDFSTLDDWERNIYRFDSFYKKREIRINRSRQQLLFEET